MIKIKAKYGEAQLTYRDYVVIKKIDTTDNTAIDEMADKALLDIADGGSIKPDAAPEDILKYLNVFSYKQTQTVTTTVTTSTTTTTEFVPIVKS